MVIRYSIRCLTCDTIHTLRISVGNNPRQEHTFPCSGCEEDLKVEMKLDFEKITSEIFCIEGCKPCDDEGIIVNLHPHFTIHENYLYKDFVFPWLSDSMKIAEKQEGLSSKISTHSKSLEELIAISKKEQRLLEGWSIIKKGWSLSLKGKDDLANDFLNNYKDIGFNQKSTLNEILFHFCGKLIHPNGVKLFLNAKVFMESTYESAPIEYHKFRKYYLDKFCNNHMEKYHEIFSEYFRDYSEYSQTSTYLQYGFSLPKDSHASSKAFKRTKMFYGNAFETLTSHLVIFACLNNISLGRPFERFENMNLENYMTLNKAKRAYPFKDTEALSAFCNCLESTLRNASHHKAIKIRNNIVSYQSGGTGALHKITYAEYLYKCNEIMFSIAALLMLELVFTN